jgi:glycosyltransferase involved in cell wall biosynthesis
MKYRFGFALTTALGNVTRYMNLRKYADRDADVECFWAPISHYLPGDPYRRYPDRLKKQLILREEARPILEHWRSLDAIMVHAFQLFVSLSLKRRGGAWPLLVLSQDYAPIRDVSLLQKYGQDIRDDWRRRLRYRVDVWFTRRADLYVPFSRWVENALISECSVPAERVKTINVGVDLELWPYSERPRRAGERARVLFVGGDFVRKGGDLLLDVVRRDFSERVELHLVTRQPPPDLPSNVVVHQGLGPNDARLRQLYADCDVFALPTIADMAPQVLMEAMATGRPVISTQVGAIAEMVADRQTGFLIEPRDGAGLRQALQALLDDPALAERMGRAGRAVVEQDFNAELSTQRILSAMKQAADRKRSSNGQRRSV